MTNEEIRDWLDATGHDRFWLAQQLSSTKGTVDQWFSKRGFPDYAIKIIEHLKKEIGPELEEDDDVPNISFTLREFELIEQARNFAGYLTRREFYRDAIIEKARTQIAIKAGIIEALTRDGHGVTSDPSSEEILAQAHDGERAERIVQTLEAIAPGSIPNRVQSPSGHSGATTGSTSAQSARQTAAPSKRTASKSSSPDKT